MDHISYTSFRGFDLQARKKKIENCMNLIPPKSATDIPIIAMTPNYFGFGCPRPKEYWEDPAFMLAYQQDGYEKHMQEIDDDMVPYFMPWYGTGVLASAFGCTIREAVGNGDDPSVVEPAIRSLAELAHLKMPKIGESGWMPRVVRCIEYAMEHGEIPVGATDLNSPLSTAAQIVGYDNLFCWMYEEPEAAEELLDMVCEAFSQWVKFQRDITGEPFGQSNGLIGAYSPTAAVWLSDDDLVSLSPSLYKEYMVPRYEKLFKDFGGGLLHWCGAGNHQLKNALSINGLKVINNSPLGKFKEFYELAAACSGKVGLQIQDEAPLDSETYYKNLFAGVDDMTGIMMVTFVCDICGINNKGGVEDTTRDPMIRAKEMIAAVRKYGGEVIVRKTKC